MADKLPPFKQASLFSYTEPPNPKWKIGDGLRTDTELVKDWKADEDAGYKAIDPTKEEPSAIYKLLVSAIVPRPIAFVSSISTSGIPNLAPFSYFNIAHHNPPLVSVCINCKDGKPKDSAKNILETKTYTVNIISEPFVEAANWTSVEAPEDVDEWIGSGLTREPSTIVKPPRVKESAFSMECELYKAIPLSHPDTPEKVTGYMLLGLIKLLHVRKAVLNEDGNAVDPHKYRAVARLGDITYSRIGEGFRIPRPQWNDVKEEYERVQGLDGGNNGNDGNTRL